MVGHTTFVDFMSIVVTVCCCVLSTNGQNGGNLLPTTKRNTTNTATTEKLSSRSETNLTTNVEDRWQMETVSPVTETHDNSTQGMEEFTPADSYSDNGEVSQHANTTGIDSAPTWNPNTDMFFLTETTAFSSPPTLYPYNMTQTEMMVYWNTFACGRAAVCDKSDPQYHHPHTCPLLDCHDCACNSCDVYGDCCVHSAKTQEIAKYTECNDAFNYYIITRCPDSYGDANIRQKCESPSDDYSDMSLFVPVYNNRSTLSYLNRYCAQCHSHEEHVQNWEPQVVCRYLNISRVKSAHDLFVSVMTDDRCKLKFSPPPGAGNVRRCDDTGDVINECNVTGQLPVKNAAISSACYAYEHIVTVGDKKYRNVFCALCNDLDLGHLFYLAQNHVCVHKPSKRHVLPFSILFNFSPSEDDENFRDEADELECPPFEVYDPYQFTCRELSCSKGRIISEHSCVDIFKTVKGVGYVVKFILLPSDGSYTLNQELSQFGKELSEALKRIAPHPLSALIVNDQLTMYIRYIPIHSRNRTHKNTSEIRRSVHHVGVKYRVIFRDVAQQKAEELLLDLTTRDWLFGGQLWRPEDDFDQFSQDLFEYQHTDPFRFDWHNMLPQQYAQPSDEAFIAVRRFTRCNQIELNRREYSIDNITGSMVTYPSYLQRNISEYFLVDSRVRICVNYSGWYKRDDYRHRVPKDEVRDEIAETLTLVCSILSLFCLVLTFVICLLSPMKDSVPGKITMVLVVSIFVSQLLFLFARTAASDAAQCQVVGVGIHYFWLAVFFWKNVAAYHMYALFTHPFKHASLRERQVRTLFVYGLYAYLTPALVVGCYSVTHIIISEGQTIGYGETACFLSSPLDVGLAFALPVGLVILSNAYFFTSTVLEIRKMSEKEKVMNRGNSSHNALFIKMSVTLGSTWVVGFLANVLQKPFMWYTFIVLNGSLGVLIFLSHVCNRNVIRLLKTRFGWYDQQSRSGTTKSPVTAQTNL